MGVEATVHNEASHHHETVIDENARDFLLAEYGALRHEIDNRIMIQHQLLLSSLIAIGTFVSIGFSSKEPLVPLLYPPLALCIASAWLRNRQMVTDSSQYVYENIETVVLKGCVIHGWEHQRVSQRLKTSFFQGARASAWGILLGTQILSVAAGLLIANDNHSHFLVRELVIASAVDAVLFALTILLLKLGDMRYVSGKAIGETTEPDLGSVRST